VTQVTEPQNEDWFRPGRFVLILAAALLGAFPKVALGLEAFFYRDFGVLGYPFLFHLREAFWRGELPLWNPLSNCGAPFLAQWNTMALYPGTWLCLVLPLPWSLSFFCLAHLMLAGMGMYFLTRKWTGNSLAASLAGFVFVFNGVTFSCVLWPNYLVALGWMPWLVWLADEALLEGGKKLWRLTLLAALQMLVGAPELVLMTWLIIAGLVILAWRHTLVPWHKLLGRFALLTLLVAGLCAAQILPFVDLLLHSQREPGFAITKWAVPGWGWANLVLPLFHCFETPQGLFFQYGQAFMSSYYPGVLVLLVAGLGAWHVRQNKVWWLTGLTLFALVMSLGEAGFLYGWLKQLFPFLSVARFPVKFMILSSFALPLLMACGIAWWLQPTKNNTPRSLRPLAGLWLGLAIAIGLLIWQAYAYPMQYDQPQVTRDNGLARLVFAALGLACLAGFTRTVTARARGWVALGLIGILYADILTHVPWQNPSLPAADFTPGWWEMSQRTPPPKFGQGRVMIVPAAEEQLSHSTVSDHEKNWTGKRLGLWSNLNLLEQTPKLNGSSTLQIKEQKQVEDLIYKAGKTNWQGLIDFLGVTWITAPGKVVDWSNRVSALPLVTAGQQPIFLEGTNALNFLVSPDFKSHEVVLVPEAYRGMLMATSAVPARVSNLNVKHHRINFEINTPAACLAVVAQSFYHPWQARVDGQPAELLRANHAFQALEVQPGRHSVELVYEDNLFVIGLVISTLSALGLIRLWMRNQ
jgi:hypothetical protein